MPRTQRTNMVTTDAPRDAAAIVAELTTALEQTRAEATATKTRQLALPPEMEAAERRLYDATTTGAGGEAIAAARATLDALHAESAALVDKARTLQTHGRALSRQLAGPAAEVATAAALAAMQDVDGDVRRLARVLAAKVPAMQTALQQQMMAERRARSAAGTWDANPLHQLADAGGTYADALARVCTAVLEYDRARGAAPAGGEG